MTLDTVIHNHVSIFQNTYIFFSKKYKFCRLKLGTLTFIKIWGEPASFTQKKIVEIGLSLDFVRKKKKFYQRTPIF